jgi:hypothetical protein
MTRQEAILEARRKQEAGEFNRAVVKREPADLNWDQLILECGHTTAWTAKIHFTPNPPDKQICSECAKEWVEQNIIPKP